MTLMTNDIHKYTYFKPKTKDEIIRGIKINREKISKLTNDTLRRKWLIVGNDYVAVLYYDELMLRNLIDGYYYKKDTYRNIYKQLNLT